MHSRSHPPRCRISDLHQCMVCKRFHALRFCSKFLKMTVRERQRVVQRFRYCENCLARSHDLRACASKNTCHSCDRWHHTLLHPSRERSCDLRQTLAAQRRNNRLRKQEAARKQKAEHKKKAERKQSNNKSHQGAANTLKPKDNDSTSSNQQLISAAICSLAQLLCAQPSV